MTEQTTDRSTKPRERETADKTASDRPNLTVTTSSVPELIKPTVQVTQAITIEHTNVVESAAEAAARTEGRESTTREPAEVRPQSIVVKPEVTTAVSESTFVEPQAAAPELPQSVKITIGRVDVRAIMPPAQSTVTVARQPAMKALSLDEYLKRRNGEHR